MWRSMSRSAPRSFSESIERVACRRRPQMRLEPITVDHVNGTVEQPGDKFFQADIVVDRPFGTGFKFYKNIDVAAGVIVAPRDRTEHGRAADAAGPQGGFGFLQLGNDIIAA